MLPVSNGIDWRYLGYDGDPIPGCPDTVEEGAAAYKKTAQDLSSGARALTTMVDSTEAIVMKTMDAIRGDADEVRTGMSELVGRYSMAHSALRDYGPALRKAQDQARAAAAEAMEAKRRYSMHVDELQAHRRAMLSFEAEQRSRAVEQAQMATTRANAANADLQSAHDRIAAAIARRDEAGEHAAGRIESGDELCGLKDSWQDRAQEVVTEGLGYLDAARKAVVQGIIDVGKWVWEHIDEISVVLDVIAIGLAVAALAFPLLAPFAAAAKLAAVGTRAIGTLKNVVGVARDVSDGDAIGAVVGVASLAAAFFLPGRVTKGMLTKVTTPKIIRDLKIPAVRNLGEKLFRDAPLVFAPELYKVGLRRAALAETAGLVTDGAITFGTWAVKQSLPSPRRVEPCLTN